MGDGGGGADGGALRAVRVGVDDALWRVARAQGVSAEAALEDGLL